MSRRLIALLLLGVWLLAAQTGGTKNDNPGELSNAHRLVKPYLFAINGAVKAEEYRQRDLPARISGAATLYSTVRCFGSQRNKEISEYSNRSLKIYELNCVILI